MFESKSDQKKLCKKTPTCYHCKGLHNSAICTKNKDRMEKLGNPTDETTTNAVPNKTHVLLQKAEILIDRNPQNNQIVKIRALFDSSS